MGSEEAHLDCSPGRAHTHTTSLAGERATTTRLFEILVRSFGDLGEFVFEPSPAMGRRWFLCLGLCLITWRLHRGFAGVLQLGAASRGAWRTVLRVRERKVNREPRQRCVLFVFVCVCVFGVGARVGKSGLERNQPWSTLKGKRKAVVQAIAA